MSTSSAVSACLDILRRTDPTDVERHSSSLVELLCNDEVSKDFYEQINLPLKVCQDGCANNRPFLLCKHNRHGNSHRSPWSNTYVPSIDYGIRPSERLRKLEIQANEVFEIYRELYYGKKSSVSSVYLWDTKGETSGFSFGGSFLIQNKVFDEGKASSFQVGNNWDSIHIVDVEPAQGQLQLSKFKYTITTTILLILTPAHERLQTTTISGSLVEKHERECVVSGDDCHIVNIGRFIEDIENEMRSRIDSMYIQSTRKIVEKIRRDSSAHVSVGSQEYATALKEAVLARAVEKKLQLSGD